MSDNFNNAASTYSDYATVQKYISERLVDIKKPTNKHYDSILEIGCGTGFLTQNIKKYLDWNNFIAIDTAKEMIHNCKNNNDLCDIEFIAESAEEFLEKCKDDAFDLIVSASVFHWIEYIDKLIQEIYRTLKTDSELIFSTYGPLMFKEFYTTIDETFSLPNYLLKNKWIELMEKTGFKNISCVEEIHKQTYKNAKEILRMINKTGVKLSTKKTISPKKLVKFIKEYDQNHKSSNGEVILTYDIFYFRAVK